MVVYFENRSLVAPGELVAEGKYRIGEGVFRDGDKIYASVLGLLDYKEDSNLIRVIPLNAKYIPKAGDLVIGYVVDVKFAWWDVDINSPYIANLNMAEFFDKPMDPLRTDLSRYMKRGDIVYAKIKSVDERMRVELTAKGNNLGKLEGGFIIDVIPAKVPRVIGRGGSMITMLKEMTRCDIIVGHNGRIWVKGPKDRILILMEAIRKIEAEAHISGLTDRIKAFLEERC